MTNADNKSNPDNLISSGIDSTELTDAELDVVAAGETKGIHDAPLTTDKMKSSQKNADAVKALL